MCVYVWLSHFAEIGTTLHVNYAFIFQKLKKKKELLERNGKAHDED